jgi:GTP-sensing pleiotropic transcriptional regulator CodY
MEVILFCCLVEIRAVRSKGNQQKQLRLMVSKVAGEVGNHINMASATNALRKVRSDGIDERQAGRKRILLKFCQRSCIGRFCSNSHMHKFSVIVMICAS